MIKTTAEHLDDILGGHFPDETDDFFDKKRLERMRPNLSRNNPHNDALDALADILTGSLATFQNGRK